ncbi:MAG: STAS domain-containing protein [Candidatus Kapaibacteriales bacterium]
MNLTIDHIDDVKIIKIRTEKITSENSSDLKAKLLIESQSNIKALIIDLEEVKSIDSTGVSALLLANRQLSPFEIPVYITGLNLQITFLFDILNLNNVFVLKNTINEAMSEILNSRN